MMGEETDRIRDMVMALSRGDHEEAQAAASEVMAAKTARITAGEDLRERMNPMRQRRNAMNGKRGQQVNARAERGVRGRDRLPEAGEEYYGDDDPSDSMGMARQDYGYDSKDDPEFQDAESIQQDINNLTRSLRDITDNGGRNSKAAKNIRAAIADLEMKAKPHTDPEMSRRYDDEMGDETDMMDRGRREPGEFEPDDEEEGPWMDVRDPEEDEL